jgi:predicted  nucleic acid-binding Zn-ribbon protein
LATELSGIRALIVQNNTTIISQQRELKQNKVNQLETNTQLVNFHINLTDTQNTIKDLHAQIKKIGKMKFPSITITVSREKAKVDENVGF